jgi:hypothetical protein
MATKPNHLRKGTQVEKPCRFFRCFPEDEGSMSNSMALQNLHNSATHIV